MDFQEYITEVELLLGRTTSPVECNLLNDLYRDYEIKDTLYWIEYSKTKDRPINYARVLIIKKCQKKASLTDSNWLENLKMKLK